MERIMRYKEPNTINPWKLHAGYQVFLYYHSSKQNETDEWVPSTVIIAGDHILECRLKAKEPPIKIGYNDLRLIPAVELPKQLMNQELDDELLVKYNDDSYKHTNTSPENPNAN